MKRVRLWLTTITVLLCSIGSRAGVIAEIIDVSSSHVSGSASKRIEKEIEISKASILSFDWYMDGRSDYDYFTIDIDNKRVFEKKGYGKWGGSIKRMLLPGKHILSVYFSKSGTGSSVAKVTDVTISSNGIIEKDDVFYLCNNDNTASLLYAKNKAEIRIPKSIEVDGNSFNISAIKDNAFEACTDLRNIVIEDSNNEILVGCNNTATHVLGLFYNCPLESVYLGRNLNYNSGSSYGYSPFFRTDRYPIVSLGDSVTAISPYLYYNNSSLTTITIPKNVVSIESNAFYGCTNLYKVVNCSNLSFSCGSGDHGSVSYYAKKVVNVNETTAIGDFQFHTSDNIHYLTNYIGKDSRLILPNSFNEEDYKIDVCAFYGYDNIESVIIPESVTSIGDYAFSGCGQLSSITIPSRVTSIGNSAFKGCIRLLSVTIGNSVLSIGSNAFTTTPKKTIWLTNTPPTGYTNAKGSINYVANDQYTSLSNTKVYPYLSSMFEVDGVKYVPVSPSERTCHAIDCAYDSTAEIINVGETTSFKGVAMKVTEVMPYTFYGNNHIKEVTMSHLGNIEDYAFYNCDSIKTVNVFNQGNIGSQAFYDCDGIGSVIVSNQGGIGNQSFYNCDGIKDVNISNLGNIGSQAFYNCDAIESVTISNQGDIGEQAFYDCNGIKTIEVHNRGVVGAQAFYGCNGMETAIVANLAPISSSNNDAPLTFADWTSTNKTDGSTSSNTYTFTAKDGAVLSFDWWVSSESGYDKLIVTLDGSTILEKSGNLSGTYSNAVSQGKHTLIVKYTKDSSQSSGSDQAKVSNIVVSTDGNVQTIAGIGSEAFSGCPSLKAITLGDSISSLGNKAFYQCTSLQEIMIPDSVKFVGEYCFSSCSGMKSATIGGGVGSIAAYTFENCMALEEVVVGDGVTTISNNAFTGCSALTNVELGNSVATINNYAFQNCSSLPEISIPQSTTTIGDYVFGGCSQLADVIIADRSEPLALGSNGSSPLFVDCPLDSVYIGGKITYSTTSSKGYSPFYRNTSLRTVVITDREEQIYDNEFYGCTNLQNVTIGNGVKSIGDYAFSGCSSLEGFSFGSSMESIGDEAFSDCTSLTSITSHAAVPPTCGTQALDDINKWECVLGVPLGNADAYYAADQWKEFFFIDDVVEVDHYVLTYVVDGEVVHTEVLKHKDPVTMLAEPTKVGYEFSGWDKTLATMPAEDVIISGTFTRLPIENLVILDTEENFLIDEEMECDTVTYTRHFNDTQWQALYVPFEIPVTEEFLASFEVADLNNVHQYDRDNDGVTDETVIEAFKLTSGTLEANYPYLIRAKEAGEKSITVTDAALYATEENSIDCSSVRDKFTFTGTYSSLSSAELPQGEGYYTLIEGEWKPVTEAVALGAFRFFLKVDSRSGAPAAEARSIRMRVIGENGEDDTTEIDNLGIRNHQSEIIYDLQGRRVENPTKGIYIVNGKRVVIK